MASDGQDHGALEVGEPWLPVLAEDDGRTAGQNGTMRSAGIDHIPADPHVIVLFGATGDLARRKLLPGLFHLSRAGMLPDCQIVATSLEPHDDDGYRAIARQACEEFARGEVAEEHWAEFVQRLSYVPGDLGVTGLAETVRSRESMFGTDPRRLHYLSVPPTPPTRWCGPWGRPVSPTGPGSSWRSRSAPTCRARAGSTHWSVKSSTTTRSSASTTSSARRPPRTSWPSGSPTGSSNRSGTASTSTTSRSTCPRHWRRVPGRLLRGDRRVPGHGRHPPVPGARLRGHGTTDRAPAQIDQRGEEQGVPLVASDRPGQRGARAVRGVHPRRGGGP